VSTGVRRKVFCPRCRYRFSVEVGDGADWSVEADCPACESQSRFTLADTRDPPQADLAELDAEVQRRGELLWRPINANRGHPAVVWMDRVGNGLFEDDGGRGDWPIPHPVYRFTRKGSGAYAWEEAGLWFVRGWHPLRARGDPPATVAVESFRAALDQLAE
jgi:hypothetical protein